MKKVIKTILIFSLISILCMSTACKDGDASNNKQSMLPDISVDTDHGGLVEETEDFIVNDGASDYIIVVPAQATAEESKAAGVIQKLFYEATGKNLPVNKDTLNYTADSTVISIGDTSIATQLDIDYREKSESGFIIKTADKSIFLNGGKNGMVYSAYELMTKLFNFDYFGEYDYYIDSNVSDVKFFKFDIVEIPDIEYRVDYVSGTARYGYDPMFREAMRVTDDVMYGYNGSHNSFDFVPWYADPEVAQVELGEYYTEHYRDWFSNTWYDYEGRPAQLCYSRYTEEYLPLALENAKQQTIKNPTKHIMTFVHQDNVMWCECETCTAHKEKYGCVSADYIMFCNKLADQLNAWAKEELNRDIKVMAFAYHANEAAPTKYNSSTGKYEAIYDEVKFSEHLYLEYAPHNCDYQIAFDQPGNEKDIRALQSWSALSSKLFMWTYSQVDYANYFMFYDNFSSMQRNYQLMVKYNVMYILEQGQWDNENCTAFNNLRTYLAYKLAWDCQADYQGLIDKYFDHVFAEASVPMREMFDFLRSYYMMLHDTGVIDGKFWQYVQEDIYPAGVVEFLKDKIDAAYDALEPLKVKDIEKYNTRRDKVLLESMFVRYVDIELYDANASTDAELIAIKKQFKTDCEKLRITRRGDGRNIELLYNEWKI